MERPLHFTAVFFVACVSVPCPAAEFPPVPTNAPIVLHVREWNRAVARLQTLVNKSWPQEGATQLAGLLEALPFELSTRKLSGTAPDCSPVLAFATFPDSESPVWMLSFPVDDFAKFRTGVLTKSESDLADRHPDGYEIVSSDGMEFYLAHRGRFAVLANDVELTAAFARGEVPNWKPSDLVSQALAAADVSLFVDMQAVHAKYRTALHQRRDELAIFQELQPETQGRAAAQLPMARFVSGVFQLVDDSTAQVVSLSFEPDGLLLRGEAHLRAGTPSAELLNEGTVYALDELGDLPRGTMAYMALHLTPRLRRAFGTLTQFALPESADKSGAERLQQGLDKKLAVPAQAQLLATSMRPNAEELSVWYGTNLSDAVAAQEAFVESLSPGVALNSGIIKDRPTLYRDAHTRFGFQLHEARYRWDLAKLSQSYFFDERHILEARQMWGREGAIWFGHDGKHYVELCGRDWYTAQDLLERYAERRNPLRSDANYLIARRALPATSSILVLLDASPAISLFTATSVIKSQGNFGGFDIARSFDLLPASEEYGAGFLGAAIRLQPGRGTADIWIPATAVVGLEKSVREVSRAFERR